MQGQDLSELLGLEAALIAPWGEDRSRTFTRDEAARGVRPLGPEHLDAAVELGLVTMEDRFRVADPRLIEGATVLVEAGVPIEAVFQLGAEIAGATDHIARLYVETITTHVVGDVADPCPPSRSVA